MQCEVTDCGHTKDGLWVRAITDCLGSQVVVTKGDGEEEETVCMSQPEAEHAKAVELGERVVVHGTGVYDEWQSQPQDLCELAEAMFSSPYFGQEMTLPAK